MKNPENKPLRIVLDGSKHLGHRDFGTALATLAVAESNLVKSGKDSAMPHFIAIVKALEDFYGFHFEVLED